MNIRNKKDFGAGIMYMVFGLFFALNALNYKMGTAAKMGPGYFPFWLGALLTALGFFILLKSMSSKNTEESIGKWDWRIMIWISGSVALYGILLPTLGFLLSVIILVFISASASHEFSWKGTALNAIFLAADNGAAGLALTARHYGVQFDVTSQYSDGSGPVGTTALTQITPVAASNYIIALGDEKKQRARYGNFNRMYFPFAFPEFSQPSFKYDLIEIQYAHNHPSSTGIARAGELNTIRIYVGASSTALSYAGASTGTEVATAFGYVGGTDSEQLFS